MINLLKNSSKFTKKGYIKLSVSLIALRKLKLVFYDTGVGIEQSKISSLFKVFGKLEDPA